MTAVTVEKRKCIHECFDYCSKGASPFTFVFSRSRYVTPTETQLQEYRDNKTIVEAHGGRMVKLEYEFAGDNPTFTQKDEQEMIQAVLRDNPDLSRGQSWNGKGYYTFSVGAKLK